MCADFLLLDPGSSFISTFAFKLSFLSISSLISSLTLVLEDVFSQFDIRFLEDFLSSLLSFFMVSLPFWSGVLEVPGLFLSQLDMRFLVALLDEPFFLSS